MEYSSVESMSEESINPSEKEKLDQLLSMRGKPLRTGKRNENTFGTNGVFKDKNGIEPR